MTRRRPVKKPEARAPASTRAKAKAESKSTTREQVFSGSSSALPPSPQDESDQNRLAPWLDSMEASKVHVSWESRLHDEIIACVSYLNETPEEQAFVTYVRELVCSALRIYLRSRDEIRVFGSTDTGLRLPGSDIDFTICAEDVFDKNNMLIKLSKALRGKEWCKSTFVIPGARVPIVSISTIPEFGSLKMDVGINNLNGLKTGEFVKERLRTMPALRPLVMVIKSALAQGGLNDASSSGISSYAVICMCVFFLQVNPRDLPQEFLSKPIANTSLGIILCGFLEYYSEILPYKKMYISVSGGQLLPKSSAGWISGDCADSLVIQCPRNPEQNITATLSVRKFEKIRGIFAFARHGFGEATASSRGILSSLVSIDSKFIKYRDHARDMVQSGQIPLSGDARPGGESSSRTGSSSTAASASGSNSRRRDLYR